MRIVRAESTPLFVSTGHGPCQVLRVTVAGGPAPGPVLVRAVGAVCHRLNPATRALDLADHGVIDPIHGLLRGQTAVDDRLIGDDENA